MWIIESVVANLKDTFASYLANAAIMFSGCEVGDKKKMSIGLGAIGALHVRGERLGELKGNLENWEAGYL